MSAAYPLVDMFLFMFYHIKMTQFNFKLVQTSIFPQQCEAIKVDYSLTPTTIYFIRSVRLYLF